ncbi:TPA: fimbrial protein [Salmonella enterica subsp. enterica serovar Chester]
MSRKYQWVLGIVAILLLLSIGMHKARADMNVIIQGTIIEPTCSVTGMDGNSRTEVNFGNVPLDAVGTAQAQQPLRMKVACYGAIPSGKTLKMYVKPVSNATMAYSGRTVLGTSMTGLGIDLADSNNREVTPQTWVDIAGVDTSTVPQAGEVTLRATLVSANTAALTADGFTASVSVVMTYQ